MICNSAIASQFYFCTLSAGLRCFDWSSAVPLITSTIPLRICVCIEKTSEDVTTYRSDFGYAFNRLEIFRIFGVVLGFFQSDFVIL